MDILNTLKVYGYLYYSVQNKKGNVSKAVLNYCLRCGNELVCRYTYAQELLSFKD